MKIKNILLSTFLLSSVFAFSQSVGINATGAAPDASAALDIDMNNKGLLIPRVSLTADNDVTTIATPATGLLVFNTNAAMTNGSVGFWYYDGTKWAQMGGAATPTRDDTLIFTTDGF